MPRTSTRRAPPDSAQLSIGALSRATGVPVETLRTWESRYGYPIPERKPSGHRVYPLSAVGRLRLVASAIAQGHRAGEVVSASEHDLERLLEAAPRPAAAEALPAAGPASSKELLGLVSRYDGDAITHLLLADWALLGPVPFLDERVGPLLKDAGEAWAEGRLEVGHEHFLSERIADVLRSLRLPLEERSTGPRAALATLPGERHSLGLEMAALIFAQAGWRLLNLGIDLPVPQIAAAASISGVRALALSVSRNSDPKKAAAMVAELRATLPRRVALIAGGEGAVASTASAEVMSSFTALDTWARRHAR